MGGDILDESFEGAGYENTWAEIVGDGSVVDEDNTDVTPPTAGGSQILKIQKVSPNFNAQARHDSGSQRAVSYTTCYVRVAAHGLVSTGNNLLFLRTQQTTSLSLQCWNLQLRKKASGEIVFRCNFLDQAQTGGFFHDYPLSGDIALDQWYRIDIKWDDDDDTYEFKVDGVSRGSGDLPASHYTPQYWFAGATDSYTLTAYFDLYNVDSSGYVSFADEFIYAGDIPVVILPNYSSILDRVYSGDIPLMILPDFPKAILEKSYDGDIGLVIIPNSLYELWGFEFVYSGDIGLVLVPSALYSEKKVVYATGHQVSREAEELLLIDAKEPVFIGRKKPVFISRK